MSRQREGDSVGLERGQMTEKGRVNVWQVSEVRKSGVRKSGVRERDREREIERGKEKEKERTG